jgi:succinate dehydrogenase / fumarate reductase flavoprotein subunit
MVPRDVASRRARELCEAGRGVGPGGRSIYLDFEQAIEREGQPAIAARYGNLFAMYERITGSDPYAEAMRIYPAPHYTMGGLWVDYNLMSTIPGLFVLGEANFSEHGANRLGASALMQGLADGLFIAPVTVPGWLAARVHPELSDDHPACRETLAAVQQRITALRAITGRRTAADLHRDLGEILIASCGISRCASGLRRGLAQVKDLRQTFQEELLLPDHGCTLDPELEKALRLDDFLDLAALMLRDALEREESCGAHFREEHQTAEGEALRNDSDYAHIAAWQWSPDGASILHREPLRFAALTPSSRSYR